jgi:hypothetical protein
MYTSIKNKPSDTTLHTSKIVLSDVRDIKTHAQAGKKKAKTGASLGKKKV